MAASTEEVPPPTGEVAPPTLNRFSSLSDLPPPRYCFNKEGKVLSYYNFNMTENSVFPDLPAEQLPLDDEYSPATLRRLNYQHENYPYLAFVPVKPLMVGMMERFDKLEFEEDARGVKLKEPIINSWFRFAEAIRGASSLLWGCAGKTRGHWSLGR